jgi:two-component system sensor histidine kinase BaeS
VRRRFTIVMVGVVAGALLVTGVGTLVLLQAQSRQDTRRNVIQLAANVAHTAALIQVPLRLSGFRTYLQRTQDLALIHVPTQASDRLPRGLTTADLHPDQLARQQTVSGFDGSVAYAVVPFRSPGGQQLAVAATQPASRGGAAGLYLLMSAAVALLVAAAAAEALARRITSPLVEAEEATRLIAAGDLSVRVPTHARATDELSSLTDSINVMAETLERLRGGERQFLMSVSHDLRTPLTSIRGFAEALADGTATDTARAADVIAAEARRLERLVRDLLDLAKLDANRFSLDLRAVDMVEVVEDTADGFVPAGDRLGLTVIVHDPVTLGANGLAVEWSAPVPQVAADPDRLAQIVANLVENAMKYAERTVEVGTWYRLAPDGIATAQVTVDDDGPGIPAEDLTRVFERLWVGARDQGRQVGSGLGLTIVAELVAAMGGSITAESPVPRAGPSPTPGTRIAVTLRTWSPTM